MFALRQYKNFIFCDSNIAFDRNRTNLKSFIEVFLKKILLQGCRSRVTRRSPISNLKEIHLSTCFSSKNAGVTVAILTIYSRIWMTASIGGGVASKRDGRTERKISRRRRRRRERDTHTHTRSYNDNCNDNIVTTIIIFIPLLPFLLFSFFLSLSLFPLPSFFLSFIYLQLSAYTHTFARKNFTILLSLFFFPSFHSSGAQL